MVDQIPRMGRGNQAPGQPPRNASGLITTGVIALIVIAVLAWLNPFYIVQTGTVGVKQSLGQTVGTIEPGWDIVLPWQNVVTYSTREELKRFTEVSAFSKDVQESKNIVSVNYRLDGSRAADVHKNLGRNFAEKIIDPAIQKRLKEIYSRYDATEIVRKRELVGKEVEQQVKENMPPGVIVQTVQIENIEFSAAYTEAIEAAARAQAEVKKTEQELARQKFEAEKVVVNAEAAAKARRAQAEAEADAIRLRGEAEALAIKARAEALKDSPALIQLTAAEKWNGVLPQTMVPGSAVPFVSVPTNAQR